MIAQQPALPPAGTDVRPAGLLPGGKLPESIGEDPPHGNCECCSRVLGENDWRFDAAGDVKLCTTCYPPGKDGRESMMPALTGKRGRPRKVDNTTNNQTRRRSPRQRRAAADAGDPTPSARNERPAPAASGKGSTWRRAVRNTTTGKTFSSITAAEQACKINKGSLSYALRHSGMYRNQRWEFVDDEPKPPAGKPPRSIPGLGRILGKSGGGPRASPPKPVAEETDRIGAADDAEETDRIGAADDDDDAERDRANAEFDLDDD